MTVGELLRKARDKLTNKDGSPKRQSDIADELGVTQAAVASWETDDATPEATRIRDVAKAYGGIDPLDLLPKKKKKRAA
jgi:transcriptional regulator with XRE-family HTH domain